MSGYPEIDWSLFSETDRDKLVAVLDYARTLTTPTGQEADVIAKALNRYVKSQARSYADCGAPNLDDLQRLERLALRYSEAFNFLDEFECIVTASKRSEAKVQEILASSDIEYLLTKIPPEERMA